MGLSQEITDRVQVEEDKRLSESLVEALLRLNDMAEQPTQVIIDFVLQNATELSNSASGYFVLLNENQTAATMYTWPNTPAELKCAEASPDSVRTDGGWSKAVRARCPVIVNEEIPPGRPDECVPQEPATLRHMDVPIFDGERMVAVAGLRNQDAPYDKNDLRQFKLLIVGMWRLLQRKEGEDRLRATAEALRRSEGYLAEAQRLTRTGSWADDGTGQPIYWSDEHYRIFGLDPQQGVPTWDQLQDRIHPDDREKVSQAFGRAVRLEAPSEADYRIVLPDGNIRHAHGIGRPVFDADGELVEVVGTTIDVTEHKRTEEALALTSFALNNANDAVALLDEKGHIIYVNDQACRTSGYKRDELLALLVWDVNPEFTPERWADHWNTLKLQQSIRFESCQRKKDGSTFPVEISAKYLEYESTAFNVAVARDITERKRAEVALRRSESYLAEAQRLTHTGSFASDSTTKPLYWSEELYRIFGFDPEFGLPDREQPLERVHPDDREKFLQAFDTAIHGKVDGKVEYRIVLPDGTVKHAHGIGHPILDEDGELVEVVGTTVDITERKRAEEERGRLHQLEADLAHINRVSMMGELTASIAHEVNQPLSGVVSNGSACLRWLGGDAPNLEEAREAARRIVRDGKRAAEIIARTRALTKRTAEHRENLDINETIRQVLPLVGDESKKRQVNIQTCLAEEVAPVVGDRVQLQQVVLNLMMNALEAMSTVTDRPRHLVITSRNAEKGEVEVTIQDSGIGLDPEQSARIFDAFYTTKPTGMGMGLSICRSILTAHGGRLWATANSGPGTTFHFTLPREQDEGNAESTRV
jgi:PAS domain S-box-containing protein